MSLFFDFPFLLSLFSLIFFFDFFLFLVLLFCLLAFPSLFSFLFLLFEVDEPSELDESSLDWESDDVSLSNEKSDYPDMFSEWSDISMP